MDNSNEDTMNNTFEQEADFDIISYFQKKIKDKKKDIKYLQKELKSLKEEINTKNNDIDIKNNEIDNLQKNNKLLKNDIYFVKKDNANLSSTNELLINKIEKHKSNEKIILDLAVSLKPDDFIGEYKIDDFINYIINLEKQIKPNPIENNTFIRPKKVCLGDALHNYYYNNLNKINTRNNINTLGGVHEKEDIGGVHDEKNTFIRPKKVCIGDALYNYYYYTNLSKNNTEKNKTNKTNKTKKTKNGVLDFDTNPKTKIIILDNVNTKAKIKIGKKTYEFLNFYNELYDIIESESDENINSLEDCTKWILESKGLPLTKANKSNWKRNILRCNEIFKIFNKSLINVYYNINNIRYIKNNEWQQWKEYLRNKISLVDTPDGESYINKEKEKIIINDPSSSKSIENEGININDEIIVNNEQWESDSSSIVSDSNKNDGWENSEMYECLLPGCNNPVPESGVICKAH